MADLAAAVDVSYWHETVVALSAFDPFRTWTTYHVRRRNSIRQDQMLFDASPS
jgi:hypothetical protein